MKTIEYNTVDKSTWGEGPWQAEPDKVQYMDVSTGLPCLIVRGPSGALCGYVGVTQDHPFFGKHYDAEEVRQKNGEWIDVHGRLTFSDFCSPHGEHGICHVVDEGEDDKVWWLGYDCAHSGDLSPDLNSKLPQHLRFTREERYRTIDYVRQQNQLLAKQLKEAA